MKYTIIGTNAAAVTLLKELANSVEHSAAAFSVTGVLADAITELQLPTRLADSAEDAMLASDVDLVILALDDSEETLRCARAASQDEKHVVVLPPPSCSPAFSFELHLILDESRFAVIPLTGRAELVDLPPNRHQLTINAAATLQLSLELPVAMRTTPDRNRNTHPHAAASTPELRRVVERGLDLLSASGLKYSQVTALDSLTPHGTLLSRLITLNAQPTSDQPLPPATLTIRPDTGVSPTSASIRLTHTDGTLQEFASQEIPQLLPRISEMCRSRELCSDWMDSYSATLELTEAVDKSLRRRRTVDVHFDTGSERGVFKSQMTALGCGVLTFMLLGMVAYLIVAQLTDLPDWVLHVGRIVWIAPLIIFLLVQALLPLARKRTSVK